MTAISWRQASSAFKSGFPRSAADAALLNDGFKHLALEEALPCAGLRFSFLLRH